MITYEPSGDRLIVAPIKEETKTASGLFIPSNEDKVTQRAIIKAISVDILKNGMNWTVGDEVLLERFAGQNIPGGLVLLGREEVMAKIERNTYAV